MNLFFILIPPPSSLFSPGHLEPDDVFHLNEVVQVIAFDLARHQLFDGHRAVGFVRAAARPAFRGRAVERPDSLLAELSEFRESAFAS